MKIAIVHYHLQRGGVTRVIENTIVALGDRAEVSVISGAPAPESGVSIPNTMVIPGLGYRPSGTKREAADLAGDLVRAAKTAFGEDGPDLWHIHNHSLGKNPCMPAVVDRLADEGARILLQVHDFSEDGRPENFRFQREVAGNDGWWPAAPQIHYAVLNSRDADFLGRAGLSESCLHLLPNPVSALPVDRSAGSRSFAEGKRFLLYPTRGIRRKNVGELFLLAAFGGERFEFATTLAPENPEWRPIHDRWREFGGRHRLPVHLGLGANPNFRFDQLIAWADGLITTSVAEGFGLAFLEPWLAGKSVVGRNLPEVTADFSARGLQMDTFYDSLRLPLDYIDADAFRRRLREALGSSFQRYGRGLPATALDRAWDACVSGDRVDFGKLDEPLQEQAIENVLRKGAAGGIADLLASASDELIAGNGQAVRRNYSLEVYGRRLISIYEKLAASEPGEVSELDGEALLDAFLDPARFCLLRS